MHKDLVDLLHAAVRRAKAKGQLAEMADPPILLEVPKRAEHGDFSFTTAMTLAKTEKKSAREVATILRENLPERDWVDQVDIAGPGYLNFKLKPSYWHQVLTDILTDGPRYGSSAIGGGQRIQVEFVSANPTGPLHVGHGRIAAVGDTLANLLEITGHSVHREYYINDLGKQIATLGLSLLARYRERFGQPAEIPAGGYHGAYLRDLAEEVASNEGPRWLDEPVDRSQPFFSQVASQRMLASIREDLNQFGVTFDEWTSEVAIHLSGKVEEVLSRLKAAGYVYEADGAMWVKTTAFGDDKDRVVIRQNGQTTYFASDLAYHRDKCERGYDRVIDVWGADHHGYVPRVQAGMAAMGYSPDTLRVVLVQLVNLFRKGQPVSMSTRSGEFVSLHDVVTEVGKDAARFFFLMRRCDSALDFDLELAKARSEENPVYYVQYAHARLCSIRREASARQVTLPGAAELDLSPLTLPEEQNLLRRLSLYPSVIEASAQLLEPHRVIFYLQELAAALHGYYNRQRVLTDDRPRSTARLALIAATQTVLANGLSVVGVTAPERM